MSAGRSVLPPCNGNEGASEPGVPGAFARSSEEGNVIQSRGPLVAPIFGLDKRGSSCGARLCWSGRLPALVCLSEDGWGRCQQWGQWLAWDWGGACDPPQGDPRGLGPPAGQRPQDSCGPVCGAHVCRGHGWWWRFVPEDRPVCLSGAGHPTLGRRGGGAGQGGGHWRRETTAPQRLLREGRP